MAKNRNKKNKAKSGRDPAAMDTSEGAPAAEAAQRSYRFFLSERWIRPRGIGCRQHRLRSVRSTGAAV